MDFSLKIDCMNDSLSTKYGALENPEVALILRVLADRLDNSLPMAPGIEGKLYDQDGNHVGQWIYQ